MKRHPEIFVRLPLGTSINRATAFNKIAVEKFFNNLEPFLAINSSSIGAEYECAAHPLISLLILHNQQFSRRSAV